MLFSEAFCPASLYKSPSIVQHPAARVGLDPLKQSQPLFGNLSSHSQAKPTDPKVSLLQKTPSYILAKTAGGQMSQVVTAQDD